jgi:hypothetical protein
MKIKHGRTLIGLYSIRIQPMKIFGHFGFRSEFRPIIITQLRELYILYTNAISRCSKTFFFKSKWNFYNIIERFYRALFNLKSNFYIRSFFYLALGCVGILLCLSNCHFQSVLMVSFCAIILVSVESLMVLVYYKFNYFILN